MTPMVAPGLRTMLPCQVVALAAATKAPARLAPAKPVPLRTRVSAPKTPPLVMAWRVAPLLTTVAPDDRAQGELVAVRPCTTPLLMLVWPGEGVGPGHAPGCRRPPWSGRRGR